MLAELFWRSKSGWAAGSRSPRRRRPRSAIRTSNNSAATRRSTRSPHTSSARTSSMPGSHIQRRAPGACASTAIAYAQRAPATATNAIAGIGLNAAWQVTPQFALRTWALAAFAGADPDDRRRAAVAYAGPRRQRLRRCGVEVDVAHVSQRTAIRSARSRCGARRFGRGSAARPHGLTLCHRGDVRARCRGASSPSSCARPAEGLDERVARRRWGA